jgi:hypothetical protein
MLCARPPFVYEGVGEILAAHLHETPAPPRTVNPAIPAPLEQVVLKALAKNPDERYQTMAAMAADLARVVVPAEGAAPAAPLPATMVLPTVPGPTTLSKAAASVPPVPAPPPARRRLVVPIAIAFAAGLGLGAVALLRVRPTPRLSTADRPRAAEARPDARLAVAVAVAIDARPATVAVIAPATPDASAADASLAVTPRPSDRVVKPPHRERRTESGRDAADAYARGITQLARRDERQALEAFRAYLRGSGLPEGRRADAEAHLITLQRKFGEIEVACEVPGAEILLDGRLVGHSPLGKSILLYPGAHELTVSKEGYLPLRKTFQIAGGQRTPFFFRLPADR